MISTNVKTRDPRNMPATALWSCEMDESQRLDK